MNHGGSSKLKIVIKKAFIILKKATKAALVIMKQVMNTALIIIKKAKKPALNILKTVNDVAFILLALFMFFFPWIILGLIGSALPKNLQLPLCGFGKLPTGQSPVLTSRHAAW